MSDSRLRLDGLFLSDTAWNYAAFALMAATGVVLNVFIAARLGVEALGVFNQIYAVYIVAAQLAVLGIHDSAQVHTAASAGEPARQRTLAWAATLLAAATGTAVAAVVFVAGDAIGRLADSAAVGEGVAWAAPGLAMFAVNKVLMGVLNGNRRMRAFAAAQSVRAATILVACLAIGLAGLPIPMLGLGFTLAELVLLPVLFVLVRPSPFGGEGFAAAGRWLGRHLAFGGKALANGFLAESYIRIDVLMLAVFVSDYAVGIYSFAALFVEGLFQVPAVVRTIANPVLVRLVKARDRLALARFAQRTMALSVAVFALAAAAVLVVFPHLAPFFPAGMVDESRSVLTILVVGLFAYAAFIPLDFVVMQAGMPGRQSLLMTVNVLLNVLLNLSLIPPFGIHGAAAATAVSFALSGLTLNLAAWRWLAMPGGLVLAGTRWAPVADDAPGDENGRVSRRGRDRGLGADGGT